MKFYDHKGRREKLLFSYVAHVTRTTANFSHLESFFGGIQTDRMRVALRTGMVAGACLALLACSKPIAKQQSPPPAETHVAQAFAGTSPGQTSISSTTTTQISSTTAAAPQTSAAVSAHDESVGPLHISGQSFSFIKHVRTIGEQKPENESTVEWWELRDAAGKAVYRAEYGYTVENGRFDTTEDVGARELKTKFGQGILVDGQGLPSAPNTGSWIQVFGLFDGKLVPLSSPVSTEGEFLEETVDTYQHSAMFKGQQPQTISRDVLKFRMWTGNFNLEYLVAIDWIQAKLHPAWTCMERTSKGPSSSCRYKVEVEPAPRTDMSFVRLFNEPDEGSVPKHVVIKAESKIEFVEAQVAISWISDEHNTTFGLPNDSPEKVWLHIRVDGQDGWISGEEDFNAVGLPEAG